MSQHGQQLASRVEELALTLSRLHGSVRAEIDDAEPISDEFDHFRRSAAGRERSLFTDVQPTDLGRPIRYAALMESCSADEKITGFGAYALRRLRAAEHRGQPLPFASLWHCRLTIALVVPMTGESVGTSARMASYHPRDKHWVLWGHGHRPHRDERLEGILRVLLGLQFTARYDWRVQLSHGPRCPRLALPCSYEEARKLFAARDLPPGKERRAALRHWVSEHYRLRETERPVAVRSHLRGTEDFVWERLECRIVPSEEVRDTVGQLPAPKAP